MEKQDREGQQIEKDDVDYKWIQIQSVVDTGGA